MSYFLLLFQVVTIQPPADVIIYPNNQICGTQSHLVTGATAQVNIARYTDYCMRILVVLVLDWLNVYNRKP